MGLYHRSFSSTSFSELHRSVVRSDFVLAFSDASISIMSASDIQSNSQFNDYHSNFAEKLLSSNLFWALVALSFFLVVICIFRCILKKWDRCNLDDVEESQVFISVDNADDDAVNYVSAD